MQVSYFETARYQVPGEMRPAQQSLVSREPQGRVERALEADLRERLANLATALQAPDTPGTNPIPERFAASAASSRPSMLS